MAAKLIAGNATLPSWAAAANIYFVQAAALNDAGYSNYTGGEFSVSVEDTAGDFFLYFEFKDEGGAIIGQPVVHGPYDPANYGGL